MSVAGYVIAIAASAPALDELKPNDKGESSVIYAADGSRLGYVQSDEIRTPIDWEQMPADLRNATVAIEDENFYKHAGVDEVVLGQGVCTTVQNCILDADGNGSALSAMANLVLDFGDDNGLTGFVGVGAGMARVSIDTDFSGTFPSTPVTGFGIDDEDSALAGQIIAGIRMPISENIDAGLKYRYFNTQQLKFSDGVDQLKGHWRSHSLLASFTYNFYSPPPPPAPAPPPPPPPPPATQTCPDGSVILATDACPVPPPPPPPPPPAPERG